MMLVGREGRLFHVLGSLEVSAAAATGASIDAWTWREAARFALAGWDKDSFGVLVVAVAPVANSPATATAAGEF